MSGDALLDAADQLVFEGNVDFKRSMEEAGYSALLFGFGEVFAGIKAISKSMKHMDDIIDAGRHFDIDNAIDAGRRLETEDIYKSTRSMAPDGSKGLIDDGGKALNNGDVYKLQVDGDDVFPNKAIDEISAVKSQTARQAANGSDMLPNGAVNNAGDARRTADATVGAKSGSEPETMTANRSGSQNTVEINGDTWSPKKADDITSAGAIREVRYGDHYKKGINGRRELLENISYVTDNGYRYTTDGYGRIAHVEADNLVLDKAARKPWMQKVAGRENRMMSDDGGHLIASQFHGSGDIDNLVAQSSGINRSGGEWYNMEQRWASALKEVPPKRVSTYSLFILGIH